MDPIQSKIRMETKYASLRNQRKVQNISNESIDLGLANKTNEFLNNFKASSN
jgi:hypothetical protein